MCFCWDIAFLTRCLTSATTSQSSNLLAILVRGPMGGSMLKNIFPVWVRDRIPMRWLLGKSVLRQCRHVYLWDSTYCIVACASYERPIGVIFVFIKYLFCSVSFSFPPMLSCYPPTYHSVKQNTYPWAYAPRCSRRRLLRPLLVSSSVYPSLLFCFSLFFSSMFLLSSLPLFFVYFCSRIFVLSFSPFFIFSFY